MNLSGDDIRQRIAGVFKQKGPICSLVLSYPGGNPQEYSCEIREQFQYFNTIPRVYAE